MNAENAKSDNVDLNAFAKLAGFPTELVKKELFTGQDKEIVDENISLEELREAMVNYLNDTFIEE